jgi:sulfate transport system substrate-binding protein
VVAADLDTTKFPKPAGLFTINDLGGWTTVSKQFFDATSGSIVQIEKNLGANS